MFEIEVWILESIQFLFALTFEYDLWEDNPY